MPPGCAIPSRRAATFTPIAEDVIAFDNHIAQVDPDTKIDPTVRRDSRVTVRHTALHRGGAGDGVHHAWELDQHTVAGELYYPPLVFGDLGVDELFPVRIESSERGGLVRTHEAAIADHISGQNSGQTAFHVVPISTKPAPSSLPHFSLPGGPRFTQPCCASPRTLSTRQRTDRRQAYPQ